MRTSCLLVALLSAIIGSAQAEDDSSSPLFCSKLRLSNGTPLLDSVFTLKFTGWTGYDSLRIWPLTQGSGKYRISAQFRVSDDSMIAPVTDTVSDSCILNTTPITGTVDIRSHPLGELDKVAPIPPPLREYP